MQGSFSLAISMVGTGMGHFGAGENPLISRGLFCEFPARLHEITLG